MTVAVHIATRASRLAVLQTEWVREKMEALYPQYDFRLLRVSDPPRRADGKDVFVKACEDALLTRKARLAVHSAKDLPARLPTGLRIGAICDRTEARDALVSVLSWEELKKGARVGTASLRRKSELRHLAASLEVVELRGNVETRLARLGDLDGIILAAAGLRRLGYADKITYLFPARDMMPAAGQGALAIEYRTEDEEMGERLGSLNERTSSLCVLAERSYCRRLGVDCYAPVGCYVSLQDDLLLMHAMVGSEEKPERLTASLQGRLDGRHEGKAADATTRRKYEEKHAEELGRSMAAKMLARGALRLLGR